MSTVSLFVGQCGNQLGLEYLNTVLGKSNFSETPVYRHYDGKLRTIHVDSEPKVTQSLLKSRTGRLLRRENVLNTKRGRGSNWALGYYDNVENVGESLAERTIDSLRREAERCDAFTGCIVTHSLSGGTGSGLGSRLVETIRDDYPLAHLMSVTVAPYWTGESPLQQYNNLLCLDRLNRCCDAIILFHNDEILKTLEAANASSSGGPGSNPNPKIGVPDLNRVIASRLCGCFAPIRTEAESTGVRIGQEPWEMFRHCCSVPDVKFLSLHQPASVHPASTWYELTQTLCRQVKRGGCRYGDVPLKSLAVLAIARGRDARDGMMADLARIEPKLKAGMECVDWNPFPIDFWIERAARSRAATNERELTVCSNSSAARGYVSRLVAAAEEKFRVRAFVHWYVQHGCEEADFEAAFETGKRIVANYDYFIE
ncbi:tubulin delta chain-like [Oscarella lobularis]|uniref:tubulin delta chain-like n=1 Tax=Oscarella lobularis TaxID=121494 RepID=UPI0033131CAD